MLNCSNEYFNFTSNRFSGIKVSSRLPLFPVLYRRRFTVVEETNKLVSGPWIGQKTLSPFHCPCTSIPIYFFVHFGSCLSADPGFLANQFAAIPLFVHLHLVSGNSGVSYTCYSLWPTDFRRFCRLQHWSEQGLLLRLLRLQARSHLIPLLC